MEEAHRLWGWLLLFHSAGGFFSDGKSLPGPGQGELCLCWAPSGCARSLAPAAGSGDGQNCH